MHDSVESLRQQATSHLDWILDAQRAGFAWIETLTQLNATTSRKLLNQVSSSAVSLNQGKSSDFLTNTGRIVADHWGASFESALRTQRQLHASATKNAPRVETAVRNNFFHLENVMNLKTTAVASLFAIGALITVSDLRKRHESEHLKKQF